MYEVKSDLSMKWPAIFLMLIGLGCSNDNDSFVEGPDSCPPYSTGSMFECHGREVWDIENVSATLTGTWEWVTMTCLSHPIDAFCNSLSKPVLTLRADHTLVYVRDKQTTITSTWDVISSNGTSFSLHTDPTVSGLSGPMYFCDEILMFNLSFADGCDQYYRKLP